jgi:hypothetical protein
LINVVVDKVETRPKADKEINSAKYDEVLWWKKLFILNINIY